MADTAKLACKIEAARINVRVDPVRAIELFNAFESLGVAPKFCGVKGEQLLVQALVAVTRTARQQVPHVPQQFVDVMGEHGGEIDHSVVTTMIYPLVESNVVVKRHGE